jgi:glycosyltransferase involved in cell wall biosynthesis
VSILKLTIKTYFPSAFVILRNILLRYRDNELIKNYFNTSHNKYALLSYITTPFKEESLTHTNFFEAKSWAKILSDLGYNVDVINYNRLKMVNLSKYDCICGFGNVFQQYFESGIKKPVVTIHYGTGMHVCHSNHASLKRVKDVFNKKGVWLGKSARFVEKTWTHQTALVDGIISLGNIECKKSYEKYYNGNIYSVPAPFFNTVDASRIIKNRSVDANKNFLWFGSSGLVHKGLDLCLDYFKNKPNLNLHICGDIYSEPDFIELYKKELFELDNIKVHGFVDITSDNFKSILEACSFCVFPSCSEGGSPSVLTVVGNGALIPIITKETTISTGYEIIINALSLEEIASSIDYACSLSNEDIINLQKKNLRVVINDNSQDNYFKQLKSSIFKIINK